MMGIGLLDLGDLLLAVVVFFVMMIVLFECAERRREGRREQKILDAIEREYEVFFRVSRL